ncbi:MOSC domain-containing protein [Longimicrobium sp.]|uniref:MOSC domain-containing protein n=1 Tax=Longimicrobium sp. TaxID=2029185 RepID=UPI002D0AE579|nr:MOSC domain-containing protein [Longimicrobium sp.]HSU14286.1 MOSC domain-containing protein [Longimicrobium sp.]
MDHGTTLGLFDEEVADDAHLSGRVEEIWIAAGARGTPRARVESVRAVAGMGLEGDRNFGRRAAPSAKYRPERQVTLIEAEAIDAVRATGRDFGAADARRNVVTRGVRLNALVGRTFRVGGVVLRGIERCDPCTHLGRLTWRGVVRDLHERGGLRAEILQGGTINTGDELAPV